MKNKEHKIHPQWYYNLYNEVFGWSRDYSAEIQIINKIFPMKNIIVEEIGAGTGNHTDKIFKQNPKKIFAIDYDYDAYNLLRKKYSNYNNIDVSMEDGFTRKEKADMIICLYSILQQTTKVSVLKNRINNLLSRVEKYNSELFIECIDTDKHYQSEFSTIYERESDYIRIKNEKTEYGVKIKYQGKIKNKDVSYEVPICNCPLDYFLSNFTTIYQIIPLSPSGRKRLIHIKHK